MHVGGTFGFAGQVSCQAPLKLYIGRWCILLTKHVDESPSFQTDYCSAHQKECKLLFVLDPITYFEASSVIEEDLFGGWSSIPIYSPL